MSLVMDTGALIQQIEARPELWNISKEEYRNKQLKEKSWMEIAAMFGVDEIAICKKWKNLKDTFRKEWNSIKAVQSTPATKRKKEWTYFQSMMFLKDIMPPHVINSNSGRDGVNSSIETVEEKWYADESQGSAGEEDGSLSLPIIYQQTTVDLENLEEQPLDEESSIVIENVTGPTKFQDHEGRRQGMKRRSSETQEFSDKLLTEAVLSVTKTEGSEVLFLRSFAENLQGYSKFTKAKVKLAITRVFALADIGDLSNSIFSV